MMILGKLCIAVFVNTAEPPIDCSQVETKSTPSTRAVCLSFSKIVLPLGGSSFCHGVFTMYIRADCLVEILVDNPQIHEIHTMDGHGRFLFVLLQTIIRRIPQRLNTLKLIFHDVDPDVTAWQGLFFPNGLCSSVTSDIFEVERSPNRLIYMNFCGLGGPNQYRKFQRYVDEFSLTKGQIFVFSVSRARGAKALFDDASWNPANPQLRNYQVRSVLSMEATFVTLVFTSCALIPRYLEVGELEQQIDSLCHLKELRDFMNHHGISESAVHLRCYRGRSLSHVKADLKALLRSQFAQA